MANEAVVSSAGFVCRHDLAADDRAGSALHALQQLLGLSGLLQAAVSGAEAKAAELTASMPEEARYHSTAGPSWLSAEDARAAWLNIAEVCDSYIFRAGRSESCRWRTDRTL